MQAGQAGHQATMTPTQLHHPRVPSAEIHQPARPWLQAHWVASVLLMLCVAVLSAQWVFHYATVCTLRVGMAEGVALALGVSFTGAIFNWVAMDLLLSEMLLPAGGHLSVTLGILVSVVLMAAAIRAVSMALQSRRWNTAGIGGLAVAGVLVGLYAASSALGFCVMSRTWLA